MTHRNMPIEHTHADMLGIAQVKRLHYQEGREKSRINAYDISCIRRAYVASHVYTSCIRRASVASHVYTPCIRRAYMLLVTYILSV